MKKLSVLILIILLLFGCSEQETLKTKVSKLEYGQFETSEMRDDLFFDLLKIENDVMYYTYKTLQSPNDFDGDQNYETKIYAMDLNGEEKIVVDSLKNEHVSDFVILNDDMYFVTYYVTQIDNDIFPKVTVYRQNKDAKLEVLSNYMAISTAAIPNLYVFDNAVYSLIQVIEQKEESYQKSDLLYNFTEDTVVSEIDVSEVDILQKTLGDADSESQWQNTQIFFGSLVDVSDENFIFSTVKYNGDNNYTSTLQLYGTNSVTIVTLADEIIENPFKVDNNLVYLWRNSPVDSLVLKVSDKKDESKYKVDDTLYQDFFKMYQKEDLIIVYTQSMTGIDSFKALSINDKQEVILSDIDLFSEDENSQSIINRNNRAKLSYLNNKVKIQYIQ